ncbi:Aldo/keto reductase [Gammaproteobacteria bacterium]
MVVGSGEETTQTLLATRPIPSSGELLPVIGLGTNLTFDVGGAAAPLRTLRAVLVRFAALGGWLIDTSPMYGNAEAVVGTLAAEAGLTQRLFWATKIWTTGKDAGIEQMEESQRRLQAHPLDLVQIHNLMEWQVHLDTLVAWKREGRIRYLGITHYHPGALAEVAEVLKEHSLDFVQVPYNIANREAEQEIFPLAADLGVAVIANVPLGHGALMRTVQGRPLPRLAAELGCRDWASFLLKFVLGHPAVTCAIPATADLAHLEADLTAGVGPFPDAAQRTQMLALVAKW